MFKSSGAVFARFLLLPLLISLFASTFYSFPSHNSEVYAQDSGRTSYGTYSYIPFLDLGEWSSGGLQPGDHQRCNMQLEDRGGTRYLVSTNECNGQTLELMNTGGSNYQGFARVVTSFMPDTDTVAIFARITSESSLLMNVWDETSDGFGGVRDSCHFHIATASGAGTCDGYLASSFSDPDGILGGDPDDPGDPGGPFDPLEDVVIEATFVEDRRFINVTVSGRYQYIDESGNVQSAAVNRSVRMVDSNISDSTNRYEVDGGDCSGGTYNNIVTTGSRADANVAATISIEVDVPNYVLNPNSDTCDRIITGLPIDVINPPYNDNRVGNITYRYEGGNVVVAVQNPTGDRYVFNADVGAYIESDGDGCDNRVILVDALTPWTGERVAQTGTTSCTPNTSGVFIVIGGAPDGDVPDDIDPTLTSVDPPDPTCESSVGAIGWLLCPVAEFLMDSLEAVIRDGIVANILDFSAIDEGSDQREALRGIWEGFRTIANLGFVIAFFVVIYSAATGGALSAYDVKRLLPKILIGAVAVQLSFAITAFIVDFFNVLGNNVVSLMLAPIGGEGVGSLFDATATGGPAGILAGLLNGLISVLFLFMLIIAALFSLGGVLLMIFVFIVRNIALMVLIVLSPLAFVAWILPNTESMFKKWWGTFIQLLAIFPIAMMFLSAGRLVSHIWSSGSSNWANNWIGLIALFAPYIVAPKLFSFAGAAIGGIVRGVDEAKGRANRLRQTETGKRLETSAKKRTADRVVNRYNPDGSGGGGRLGRRLVNSGVGQRVNARTQARHEAMISEDEKAADINLEGRIAGMNDNDRQAEVRRTAVDGDATMETRRAAMNRMLIDKDYDGLEHAMIEMAQSEQGRAEIDRFKKQNAGDLATNAHNLLTTDTAELQARSTAGGARRLATSKAEKIMTQNSSTMRSSVAELRRDAASGSQTAGDSQRAMERLVDTYDRLDQQAKDRMDQGTIDAIELARSTVQVGPPSPTTQAAAGRAQTALNGRNNQANSPRPQPQLNLPT